MRIINGPDPPLLKIKHFGAVYKQPHPTFSDNFTGKRYIYDSKNWENTTLPINNVNINIKRIYFANRNFLEVTFVGSLFTQNISPTPLQQEKFLFQKKKHFHVALEFLEMTFTAAKQLKIIALL
jgi:hypothetical protein